MTSTPHPQSNNTTSEPPMTMYSELEHLLMSGSLAFIILVTLVGNIMVCWAVYRHRKLRTRTNMYLINLSCADIGVAVLCMPFSLITCLHHEWLLGDPLCKLNGFLNIVFTQTSLLSLMAISVETYFAICKPLYHRHMSRNFAIGLLALTWVWPIVIACVPFLGISSYVFKPETNQCAVQFPVTFVQTIYASCVIFFGFVIPLCIMGFTYSNIFRSARRYTRRMSRLSLSSTTSTNTTAAHRQVAVTVLILLVMFILCWLPYFTFVILVSVDKSLSTNRTVLNLGKAAYWCAFSSSASNPYIYGFRNPQIRKEFQTLFCLLCPCVRGNMRGRGCSTTSGGKGSWDGSGFDYNHLPRPSHPCPTPRGRQLSVDFAPLPGNKVETYEILVLKAKLSSCSSDPGYSSQEENGVLRKAGEERNVESSNNHNIDVGARVNVNSESKNQVEDERLKTSPQGGGSHENSLHNQKRKRSSDVSCDSESQIAGSFEKSGVIAEYNAAGRITSTSFAQEKDSEKMGHRSVSSNQSTDSLSANQLNANELNTSLSELLTTLVRPRQWSFKTPGTRLKLGWIESAL